MPFSHVDLNILLGHIRSPIARFSAHFNLRRQQRKLPDFTTLKLSIIRGFEVVEYQAGMKVILLSRLENKRQVHTVWFCDGVQDSELVTAYYPDPLEWEADGKTHRRPS